MNGDNSGLMTARQVLAETERCLLCFDAPCTVACPAHIDIPGFITMIRSGNVIGAAQRIRTANVLAAICGKVCPEEVFCQSVCIRAQHEAPIAIRELHLFATREELKRAPATPAFRHPSGRNAAVIGGGPAGLACAFELAKFGHSVDLYDRFLPGGVPRNSIPAFRLTSDEIQSDITLLAPSFTFHQEHVESTRFEDLRKHHGALFISVGLGKDKPLPIPGSEIPGVIPVLGFLESAKAGRQRALSGRVAVIGGGNVSLDAAATAKLLAAREVVLLYRRSAREMRIWKSELKEARERGVEIRFLVTPVEILGQTTVEGVRCRRTRLSDERDATGRNVPVEIEGSDFVLEADAVIVAIGQVPDADFLSAFERTPAGYLSVDADLQTSLPGVFAGGDVVGGEGTIVQSVAHGKRAGRAMHQYLSRR